MLSLFTFFYSDNVFFTPFSYWPTGLQTLWNHVDGVFSGITGNSMRLTAVRNKYHSDNYNSKIVPNIVLHALTMDVITTFTSIFIILQTKFVKKQLVI